MSRVVDSPAVVFREIAIDGGGVCDECGYDLRGLPEKSACPECGHMGVSRLPVIAGSIWARSVTAGLVLLLLLTISAIASVLIQPFGTELGGTLPALNFPGPKLWVMPLLQRPIGQSPELPGVMGTRTAVLSLLAVWLITSARPGSEGGDPHRTARLAARYTALVVFGAAFGVLVAIQGLWPNDLPPYRLLLVGAAELPATALLYHYLWKLSREVPGRDRREVFFHLQWIVPLTMLVGVGIMTVGWQWQLQGRNMSDQGGMMYVMAGGYGVIAVGAAVVAIAAVGGLALAFLADAVPSEWGILRSALRLVQRIRNASGLSAENIRRICPAVGAALFCMLIIPGNDQISWYTTRVGVGGNLPFYNFPGPKFWAAASSLPVGSDSYGVLCSRTTLAIANLLAVWLITIETPANRKSWLRRLTRWGAVVALGLGIALMSAWFCLRPANEDFDGKLRSEYFAFVTLLCELPVTVLVYLYMAGMAESVARRPDLRRSLYRVAIAVVGLVTTAATMFAVSRHFLKQRQSIVVQGMCGMVGIGMVVAAVWATVRVMALARALAIEARRRESTKEINNRSAKADPAWRFSG